MEHETAHRNMIRPDPANGHPAPGADEREHVLAGLAASEPGTVGAAVTAAERVEETVAAMISAGADISEVLDGLVMAGLLRPRQRRRDRLPLVGGLLTRRSVGYEPVAPKARDWMYH